MEFQNSELSLLNKIIRPESDLGSVVLPNGDDAAVIEIGDSLVAVTTDAIVENKHFSLAYFSGKQIGIKAVESAVSDLIAVGAVPEGIVISLSLPKSTDSALIEDIYRGVYAACDRIPCKLLGGDITATANFLEIVVTALGQVKTKKDILTRSGVLAGDLICVTGTLGGSQAGLRVIQNGLVGYDNVKLKHLEPHCRSDLVGKIKGVHAAIDVSDGLSSEINHLCRSSHCGAMLKAADIPINSEVKKVAQILQEDPLDYALNGGEDYELLLAVSPKHYRDEFGTVIGVFTEDPKVLLEIDNEQLTLAPAGYDHLS